MEYSKYIKYIGAIVIGYIGYFIFGWVNRNYAQSFRHGISGESMILQSIYLLAGLVIACTVLIIFSVKSHGNR